MTLDVIILYVLYFLLAGYIIRRNNKQHRINVFFAEKLEETIGAHNKMAQDVKDLIVELTSILLGNYDE